MLGYQNMFLDKVQRHCTRNGSSRVWVKTTGAFSALKHQDGAAELGAERGRDRAWYCHFTPAPYSLAPNGLGSA